MRTFYRWHRLNNRAEIFGFDNWDERFFLTLDAYTDNVLFLNNAFSCWFQSRRPAHIAATP